MNAVVADNPTPVLLTYGFRPFFLAAGVWSAVALAIWIVMLETGSALPSRFDPLNWHIHEMLFGFVMAAIAGLLLTAIANWTGRPPVRGGLLGILTIAWLLGRIVCLVSVFLPAAFCGAVDLAFPLLLIAVVAREIIAARNWRNLAMIAPLIVLTVANLLMHLQSFGFGFPVDLGWRLGLAAIVVLISVVAGRIVPVFTRNWLMARGDAQLPAPSGLVDRAALGLLHAGVVAWAFLPDTRAIGTLLLAGAAANLWRLWRWRGRLTGAEPLLVILHIGYAWLVLGVALLGLSVLGAVVPATAAIHSRTAGAIGAMILAVMTRATRGHTGRALAADRVTTMIYGLVTLAAIARIAAAFGLWPTTSLVVAAILWIAAFGLFVIDYSKMLLQPRQRSTELLTGLTARGIS